jgi:uncharacterized coiled-coil DUF342 family protein
LQELEEAQKGLDQEEKIKKLRAKINKVQAELDRLEEELKALQKAEDLGQCQQINHNLEKLNFNYSILKII